MKVLASNAESLGFALTLSDLIFNNDFFGLEYKDLHYFLNKGSLMAKSKDLKLFSYYQYLKF